MAAALLVTSARLDRPGRQVRAGPRKDYVALAEALGAQLLDRAWVERHLSARAVRRLFGAAVAQAWLAFRLRGRYGVIVTDGEHIAIPLALLLKLARARTIHVAIGHRLSSRKKRLFFTWLRVHTHMHRIAVHSRRQREIAVSELGVPADQLALLPYQVDARFWQPVSAPEERLVCSAGLEFRDYPTLFEAVDGLAAEVVVGAASYWSRRRNSAASRVPPPNVRIGAFDYAELRDLYARSAVVVIALEDVDFQAGVTTLLEAMAMGKAVIVTHTQGQTDVVQDRRAATRAVPPRPVPPGFAQLLGIDAAAGLRPNGFYVPPRDPIALRRAITFLLDHPEDRARLGRAARRTVEGLYTLELFAERMRLVVEDARSRWARRLPQSRLDVGRPALR